MNDREKWIVGQPGGPAGPFYSVVSSSGRVIAMQVIDLDGATSNDRDYAEEMIEMVLPYLDGAMLE